MKGKTMSKARTKRYDDGGVVTTASPGRVNPALSRLPAQAKAYGVRGTMPAGRTGGAPSTGTSAMPTMRRGGKVRGR